MVAVQTALVNSDAYDVGKILEGSWGWEQTNVDFYVIVKRNGVWITIQKIDQDKVYSGDMTGTCTPVVPVKIIGKPKRKKLAIRDGVIIGCRMTSGYGWIDAWNGQPAHWSSYA